VNHEWESRFKTKSLKEISKL